MASTTADTSQQNLRLLLVVVLHTVGDVMRNKCQKSIQWKPSYKGLEPRALDALAIEMELKILHGEGKKSTMPFKMKSLIFKYVFVFVSTSFTWWEKVGFLGQTNFEKISYSTTTLSH